MLASKLVNFITSRVPSYLINVNQCKQCNHVASTRSQVCSVGTQVRGYDIDCEHDSTFGSLGGDLGFNHTADIIDLSNVDDNLLNSTNYSFTIPTLPCNGSRVNANYSNFKSGDQTLGT